MSRATLITIIASVLILGGIIFISYPKGNTRLAPMPIPGAAAALVADQASFDFGTISMANGKVSHDFTFKNTGNGPINLTKLYTSCMCTTADIELSGQTFGPYGMVGMGVDTLNEDIQPGEEARITAIFDPAAHGPAGVGNIVRDITVENNAGDPLVFQFTATVTP